jgi:hypothetical protein
MISGAYIHGTGSQPMAKMASYRKKKVRDALARAGVMSF